MVKRVIVWTETASKQRREILKYWTVRNGSTRYAKKLIRLTKERLEFILENPESFKLSTYPETREAAFGNFSIYYKLIDNHLVVTAFWDNRQNPLTLYELFTK